MISELKTGTNCPECPQISRLIAALIFSSTQGSSTWGAGVARSVAILGIGNVALDCARVLLAAPDHLAATDIADRALQQLRRSGVRDVHLIARRSHSEVPLPPVLWTSA